MAPDLSGGIIALADLDEENGSFLRNRWASFIFLLTLFECILYFQATSFIYFGGLDRRSIQIIMTDFPLYKRGIKGDLKTGISYQYAD